MTPSFRWVFLLALVGRAASVPDPVVVDACALLCNPGAETESERARDPKLYPRYPKVNCHPQSVSDNDQAWRIASHCLKLCNEELSVEMEVNCFALRSSLGSNLGCYCEALTPLSPNTMRLHESWRLNFLVKELAKDIMDVILDSPLDMMILCEIHSELYNENYALKLPDSGKIIDLCKNESLRIERTSRSVNYEDSLGDDVVDVMAEDELLDRENRERVARGVLKDSEDLKDNKLYMDSEENKPDLKTPRKKDKVKTEEKKKEKSIDLGKENEAESSQRLGKSLKDDSGKNKMEDKENEAKSSQRLGKSLKDDSGKNKMQDNGKKGDAMLSKNSMENNKKDKERDNAKSNMKDNMKINEKSATNQAKSKEELLEEKLNLLEEKNKKNADSKLRTLDSAQNDKKVKEDNKSNNQQNDMKDNAKNAAKDNAKNDKEDSKTESKKDDAESNEKRGKRDYEIMDAQEFNDEVEPDYDEQLTPREMRKALQNVADLVETTNNLMKEISHIKEVLQNCNKL